MECRICYDNTDEELIEPCKCSGSMRYVHRSCLDKWIYHKKDNICPVCKSEYIVKDNSNFKGVIRFLLNSDLVTTILTFVICIVLLHISNSLGIKTNTLAVSFLGLLFGMNYIQIYLGHKEIDFDFIFNYIYLYSSNDMSMTYNCFSLISMCMWLIIDRIKYKCLSMYL